MTVFLVLSLPRQEVSPECAASWAGVVSLEGQVCGLDGGEPAASFPRDLVLTQENHGQAGRADEGTRQACPQSEQVSLSFQGLVAMTV